MNNIRALLFTVLVDVVHIKLFCKQGIPLNRNHGVFLAVHVLCLNVHLGTIESRFSDRLIKRNLKLLQYLSDVSLRLLPDCLLADILILIGRVPLGKPVGHVLLHAQRFQAVPRKGNTVFKFLYHLIRPHNQMTFGYGELTDTGKSVHLAGILITEQRRSLSIAQGQIPVGFLACFINIVLERTRHGTQGKYFLVLFLVSQHKHTIRIMVPVSGNFIQIALCHKRR